jgi:cytochrome c556
MNRRFALLVAGLAALFGMTLAALEKPTPEFQNLMKSNASIVDLAGANNALGRDTNVDVNREDVGDPSIRTHLKARDFDAIVKDAATLKQNFARIEAFWAERRVDDAVAFSKAAIKAVTDIETAAQAKDAAAVTKAQAALADTCRACHLAHRVVMLTERTFQLR